MRSSSSWNPSPLALTKRGHTCLWLSALCVLSPAHGLAQERADSVTRPEWLEGSITLPFELVGLVVGVAIACGLIYFAIKWLRPSTQTQADRERKSRAATAQTTQRDELP